MVRITAQDTYEHITDFSSAADHVLTERKFAEMGVPIVKKVGKGKAGQGEEKEVSVFEGWIDNTDPDARLSNDRREGGRNGMAAPEPKVMQRWKYAGPWISGMQEGEFARWLGRGIEGRKDEWREFVRKKEVDSRIAQAQRQAREQGEPMTQADIRRLRVEMRPTDEQMTEIEKTLRDTHVSDRLSSNLTALIAEFLDLPNIYQPGSSSPVVKTKTDQLQAWANQFAAEANAEGPPPTTHPSAGLSHLRSNAVMSNHPLYGPQAFPTPIQARVVRARLTSAGQNEHNAKLGAGGFIANDPHSETSSSATANRRATPLAEPDRMTRELDEELEGGNKVWVQAGTAFVDERGRVQVRVQRAEPEALAVRRGGEELERVVEAKRASRLVGMGASSEVAPRGPTSRRGFGID